MPPITYKHLQAQWQLARLIGRTAEQDQLQRLLQEDIPQRRGRTVVISGPVGNGRVALARWALSNVYSLPHSVELDAGTSQVQWFVAEVPEQARLRRAFDAAVADIAQRLPFPLGTLVAVLAAFAPEDRQDAVRARLRGGVTPRVLPSLVEDIAGTGPLALHITGLDAPSLADEWHDALIELVKMIHARWPVLLLLTTVAVEPLATLDEPLLTPLQRRLRPLIAASIVQAWQLGPVSVADVRRYIQNPADELVIQRLHALSGGWPLMIQALWDDWTNSAQKPDGGGSTRPVIARAGEGEPWCFTIHGLTATAHVEMLLDDLLAAYHDGPEMLAAILDDDEDWKAVLRWLLALGTLEGPSFTGMAVAYAAELPWPDVEAVLDALVDAGVLADAPGGHDTLMTDAGAEPLYRYTFALPIWWYLFRRVIPDDELGEDARFMAEALEHCYGPLAWQHLGTIVHLWELAADPGRVRLQRRVLEQRAYIARLTVRAQLAEQHAEGQGTWLNAYGAWMDVAQEMQGYVPHADTFAAFGRAQYAAQQAGILAQTTSKHQGAKRPSGSRLAEAETLWLIANWAAIIGDDPRAAAAVEVGVALLDGLDDGPVRRVRGLLLYALGVVHQQRNELDEALRTLEQARVLSEAHSTPRELAAMLHALGVVHQQRNESAQALRTLEQARALKEAHGMPRELANTLHALGVVHQQRNELDEALRTLEQARVLSEAHSTPRSLATTLHELGRLHHAREELDEALRTLEQARVLREVHDTPRGLAVTLHCLAQVRYDRHEYDQALLDIRRALDIERSIQAEDIDTTEALERRIQEALDGQGEVG